MPGLIAWNEVNANFKESDVACELEKHGCFWSITEGHRGKYKARISSPNNGRVGLDLETLQTQTHIELELSNG